MWIGCARIAYGARNATKQNWYATTPPGDLVAHDQRGAEQHRDVGLQRDPRREPEQATELAVDRAEGGAQPEPGPQERDRRHADEADDAERAPDGEHELLGAW